MLYLLTQKIVRLLIQIGYYLNLPIEQFYEVVKKVLLFQILACIIHGKHEKLIKQQEIQNISSNVEL